jgi:O-antigen/teichoic acid export membrane protein
MVLACFQGTQRFGPNLYVAIGVRVGSILAVLTAFLLGLGLAGFLALDAVMRNVVTVAAVVALGASIGCRPVVFPRRKSLRHIKASMAFGLTVALETLYWRGDMLLVWFYLGDVAAGWYQAAYTLYTAPLLFAQSAAAVFYPWVAERTGRGATVGGRRETSTAGWMLLYGAIAGTGLAAVGPSVLVRLFGTGFMGGAPLLQVLAIGVPLVCLNRFGIVILKGEGLIKSAAMISAVAAVVAITGNVFLLPRLGITGAAWMTVVTEAALLVLVVMERVWRPPLRSLATSRPPQI